MYNIVTNYDVTKNKKIIKFNYYFITCYITSFNMLYFL